MSVNEAPAFAAGEMHEVAPILAFLAQEVERRDLPITLYDKEAVVRGRQLKVAAYVAGEADAVDKARMLQSVEDAWNDRDPEPSFIVTLLPTRKHTARAIYSVAADTELAKK